MQFKKEINQQGEFMKKLLTGLAILAFACAAQAAVIANYTFAGSSAADQAAYGNMTAGSIALSAGSFAYVYSSSTAWNAAGASAPFADHNFTTVSGGWAATSQGAARNWFFTITPSSGFQITLSSLSFLYHTTTGAAQNLGWSIAGVDQDAFARASTVPAQSYSSTVAVSYTSTAATVIRIQGWNGTGASGNFRIDNIVLNGTVDAVPVPEPATMSLLGLGALAMVLRRKMKK
jgi:hypothetical protein